MLRSQQTLPLSEYTSLYDILVNKENKYRVLHDAVDYSFIHPKLESLYSDMGRIAKDPVQMVKYLMIKQIEDLSDEDLVSRVRTDPALKYFPDMSVDEMPIESSTLSAFRTRRLGDTDLLPVLLGKTFELAADTGVLRRTASGRVQISPSFDSTHIPAMGECMQPMECVEVYCRRLYKAVVAADGEVARQLPRIPHTFGSTSAAVAFAQRYIARVRDLFPQLELYTSVLNRVHRLAEILDDLIAVGSYCPADPDARVGHKSETRKFSGYKSHLATDAESGLIVDAVVALGDSSDTTVGRQMIEDMMDDPAFEIETMYGDSAYGATDIIKKTAARDIEMIAPPNPALGSTAAERDGFTFNKDSNQVVCPAGRTSKPGVRKTYAKERGRQAYMYYFDVDQCQCCPLRDGCYKPGAKSKSYFIPILTDLRKSFSPARRHRSFVRNTRNGWSRNASTHC